MIKQLGTKVYYNNTNGQVLKIIGDMQGYVKETTFEEDILAYEELNTLPSNIIDALHFVHGQYQIVSKDSTGIIKVNVESKEIEFDYIPVPEPEYIPTEEDKLREELEAIRLENEALKEKLSFFKTKDIK